jgi:hypothetical protein
MNSAISFFMATSPNELSAATRGMLPPNAPSRQNDSENFDAAPRQALTARQKPFFPRSPTAPIFNPFRKEIWR